MKQFSQIIILLFLELRQFSLFKNNYLWNCSSSNNFIDKDLELQQLLIATYTSL